MVWFYKNTIIGKRVDYVSGPYKITLPSGMTKAPLCIPITRDGALEGTESFKLFIKNNSLPAVIFFSEYSKTTANISRHTVVCRAAQENGARANGSEYINRNNKVAIFTHS